jgi:hypothetical protein
MIIGTGRCNTVGTGFIIIRSIPPTSLLYARRRRLPRHIVVSSVKCPMYARSIQHASWRWLAASSFAGNPRAVSRLWLLYLASDHALLGCSRDRWVRNVAGARKVVLRVYFFALLTIKFWCRSITQVPVVGTQEQWVPKAAAMVDTLPKPPPSFYFFSFSCLFLLFCSSSSQL